MVFRRPLQAAVCSVLAALLFAPGAHALDSATVRRELSGMSRHLSSASGGYVRDLTTGRTLFSRQPDTRRSPASNEKLLTTSTALLRYGPGARFQTTLQTAAAPRDGVIHGDVALVGAGDPFLVRAQLRLMASQLSALGVTEITGRVLGDGSIFDTRAGSYDSGYAYDSDIGGTLGGLVVDESPTRDPALHAAAMLRQALLDADITVGKGSHDGSLGPDAATLTSVSSPTLAAEIALINIPSDNFAAEMLLKDLGAGFDASGSTPSGARVVSSTLRPLGLRPRVVDGSGLSRTDHVSPREIVTLLTAMAARPEGAALRASLATAGRTGTLAYRMRRTAAQNHCQAKTGTLSDVSTLSGYCTTQGGDLVAFSFLENAMNASSAKTIEDRMLPVVARYAG